MAPTMLPPRHVEVSEIVALLSPTLGQEKSRDVVEQALRQLGVGDGDVPPRTATAVLDLLAPTPGLIGVAARFARLRGPFQGPSSIAPPAPGPSAARRPCPDIVSLLAQSLGQEKSVEVVTAACQKLGLWNREDESTAILVLDELARAPGPVGVVARFVKMRLMVL